MVVADTTIQEYNLIKRMIMVLERYTDLVVSGDGGVVLHSSMSLQIFNLGIFLT